MVGKLKDALRDAAEREGLIHETVQVECAPLTPEEAIGAPEHQDYPIQRGREVMLQVRVRGAIGQAFSRETVQRCMTLQQVLDLPLENDWQRAVVIACANAVFALLGLVDSTVHCRDQGPVRCAGKLSALTRGERVALFGLQPRFVEALATLGAVRCVDIDPAVVGTRVAGVAIEPPERTGEVVEWAERVLVTGSALVNDTFTPFLGVGKPLHIFGTTGAAMAHLLELPRYCHAACV